MFADRMPIGRDQFWLIKERLFWIVGEIDSLPIIVLCSEPRSILS